MTITTYAVLRPPSVLYPALVHDPDMSSVTEAQLSLASSASEVGAVVSSNSLPLFEFAQMRNQITVGLKRTI